MEGLESSKKGCFCVYLSSFSDLLILLFSRSYDSTYFLLFKAVTIYSVCWGRPPVFRLIGCFSAFSQHQQSISVLRFNNSVGKETDDKNQLWKTENFKESYEVLISYDPGLQ